MERLLKEEKKDMAEKLNKLNLHQSLLWKTLDKCLHLSCCFSGRGSEGLNQIKGTGDGVLELIGNLEESKSSGLTYWQCHANLQKGI